MSTVLVTGGSGFVASHVILRLLKEGHAVRTTLRDAGREAGLRLMLRHGGQEPGDRLQLLEADLTRDRGWDRAVLGCAHVLHVASPFPQGEPEDADEVIVPAREGVLRVLRAARDAGVRRVVLTSSFAAVGYGRVRKTPFTEEDWTEPDAPNPAYIRSKAIAERAAWDFMEGEGGALELSVVNPTGIFGPVLGGRLSASVALIKRMLDGDMAELPDIWFGVVDVRDVAGLHLQAMTRPEARGERFIAVAGPSLAMSDVAAILRRDLGDAAARVPVPLAAPDPGRRRDSTSAKAERLLGWWPRPADETITATARSLIEQGLLKR